MKKLKFLFILLPLLSSCYSTIKGIGTPYVSQKPNDKESVVYIYMTKSPCVYRMSPPMSLSIHNKKIGRIDEGKYYKVTLTPDTSYKINIKKKVLFAKGVNFSLQTKNNTNHYLEYYHTCFENKHFPNGDIDPSYDNMTGEIILQIISVAAGGGGGNSSTPHLLPMSQKDGEKRMQNSLLIEEINLN